MNIPGVEMASMPLKWGQYNVYNFLQLCVSYVAAWLSDWHMIAEALC